VSSDKVLLMLVKKSNHIFIKQKEVTNDRETKIADGKATATGNKKETTAADSNILTIGIEWNNREMK